MASSTDFNKFCKLRLKRERHLNHLSFLLRCKRAKVIPKFISLKCSVKRSLRVSNAVFRSHFLVLRSVIQDTRYKISCLEKNLYTLHLFLARSFPSFSNLEASNWANVSFSSCSHRNILDKKFNALLRRQHPTFLSSRIPQSHFINYSSHTLSNEEKDVLSLGLNYAVTSRPQLPKLIAPIESSLKHSKVSAEQKDSLRHILADALLSNSSHPKHNLTLPQRRALCELQNNPNIIITKADKGGQTVLFDRLPFLQKTEQLLREGPYVEIKKDPSDKHLSAVRSSIKKFCYS